MTADLAIADRLRALPPHVRAGVVDRLRAELGPQGLASLRYDPAFWARPSQALPDPSEPWTVAAWIGEQGTGKSWCARELFIREIESGRARRPRITAATDSILAATVVHGPSGLLAWLPPHRRPTWKASRGFAGELHWPNGVVVVCCSAQAPGQAIGIGVDLDWRTDLTAWIVSCGESTARDTWVRARKSTREGLARAIVDTTPEGADWIEHLGELSGARVVSLGTVERNAANLPPQYLRDTVADLKRSGEWNARGGGAFSEIVWRDLRVDRPAPLVALNVTIDPAKSSRSRSCEVGIVATGIDARGVVYGLDDRSAVLSSDDWPDVAHELLEELQVEHPRAEARFVAENNAGGDAPAALLRAAEKIRRLQRGKPGVSVIEVREVTARKNDGKARRASPIVALAKGGQVRMLRDLGVLEGQLSALTDEGSGNDRADAFVHGARDLAGLGESSPADAAAAAVAAAAGLGTMNRRVRPPAFSGSRV